MGVESRMRIYKEKRIKGGGEIDRVDSVRIGEDEVINDRGNDLGMEVDLGKGGEGGELVGCDEFGESEVASGIDEDIGGRSFILKRRDEGLEGEIGFGRGIEGGNGVEGGSPGVLEGVELIEGILSILKGLGGGVSQEESI